jgi:hypothetical protein
MSSPESTLLQSWHANADAWIEVIRSGAIESRQQVTDQAILLAIMGANRNACWIWVAAKAGCCARWRIAASMRRVSTAMRG